jgi:hypothetical protein
VSRRLAVAVVWLLLGETVAGAVFWTLLGVPESSGWTLGFSLLLSLLILAAVLWTIGGVFALWRRPEAPVVMALRGALRYAFYVALGALLFFVVWWATARAIAWHQSYGGQIDAWIIARSGRSETKLLHDGIEWFIWTLRWGIGLTLALSLVADLVASGWPAFGQARWVGRAFHPKRWMSVALLVGLTQLLPWHYVSWRPHRMSLGMEPWFVGVKLTAMAILSALGAVMAVGLVAPPDDRPS